MRSADTFGNAITIADKAFDQGDWATAAAHYLAASEESAPSTDRRGLKLRARALRGLGAATFRGGDINGAREHLLAARAQCEEARDPFEMAEVSLWLGRVHREQQDAAEALRLAELARTTFVRAANRLGEAESLLEAARAHLLLADHEAALRTADGAAAILRSRGRAVALTEAYRVAGDALLAERRHGEAESRFRSALGVAQENDNGAASVAALEGIARTAISAEDRDAAEEAMRQKLRYLDPTIVAAANSEAELITRLLEDLVKPVMTPTPLAEPPINPEPADETSMRPSSHTEAVAPEQARRSEPVAPPPDPPTSPRPHDPANDDEQLDFGVLTLHAPSALVRRSPTSAGVLVDLGSVLLDISLFGASLDSGRWSDFRGQWVGRLRDRSEHDIVLAERPLDVFVRLGAPYRDHGENWLVERLIGREGQGWFLRGVISIAQSEVPNAWRSGTGDADSGDLRRDMLAIAEVQRAEKIFRSVVIKRLPSGAFPMTAIRLRA